jgi:hypothetical protein
MTALMRGSGQVFHIAASSLRSKKHLQPEGFPVSEPILSSRWLIEFDPKSRFCLVEVCPSAAHF